MSELALRLIAKEKEEKTGKLDLGNCGLTEIPPELFELTWLEELRLSNRVWDGQKFQHSKNGGNKNDFKHKAFPKAFRKLQELKVFCYGDAYSRRGRLENADSLATLINLQTFHLDSNQITNIDFLAGLSGLQTLSLRSNLISDISILADLTGLLTLDLHGNQISDISFLAGLTRIQALNLSSNPVRDTHFLSNLTSLQALDLGSNQINDIGFLSGLTDLQTLDLGSNQINDIRFLADLTSLQTLSLCANQIEDISFLSGLTALQSLDLSSNQIRDFSSLPGLIGLLTLDIGSNQISDIGFLASMTSLETLDLSSNEIQDVSSLSGLRGLQALSLRSNQINDISFLTDLTGLRTLSLSSNQINDFSFLARLSGLQSLDLGASQISDVSFLSGLRGLQDLYLSSNQISDISFLEGLTGLQTLYLSSNQISDISFLEGLTHLQTLDLNSNQISDITPLHSLIKSRIPVTLKRFGTGIVLHENPITKPPIEIVEQGNEAIVNWIKQSTEQGLEPFYEAKVMVLGQGGAGKTSFTQLQLNPDYKVKAGGQKSTLGVVIHKGKEFKHTKEKEVIIKGHLWDFGGQDIQKMLHQFFITTNCLYILVSDKRADNTNFDYWFQMINLLGPKSTVIVVENPKDMDAACEDFPLVKYRNLYPGLMIERVEVNLAKTRDEDLEEWGALSKKIEKYLSGLEIVNRPVPRKWLKVRDEIEVARVGKFITLDDFYKITGGEDIGLTNDEADLCLTYLNDIGELAYFKDRALENYLFLDHNWLIRGMYYILADKSIKDANGKFTKDRAFKAWEEEGLTSLERTLLLELLLKDKFDICYELLHKKNTFITPLLISSQKGEDWPYETRIRFRYEYDFMPLGLFSRLIVRLHKKIDQGKRWKTGLRLVDDYEGVPIYGEVEEYKDPKGNMEVIDIKLSGHAEGCKELLGWVRMELNTLHDDFKNLKPNQMVACNCNECTDLKLKGERPGFHSYQRLLNRLSKGHYTISCTVTEESVNIGQILGDVVLEEVSKNSVDLEFHSLMKEKGYTMNGITINQTNNQHVEQHQTNEQTVKVSIEIEMIQKARDEADLLKGSIVEQKGRLLEQMEEEDVEDTISDLTTVQDSLNKLEKAQEANQKPPNKVQRVLGQVFKDFEDEESPIRKTLKHLRRGKDYGVNLAKQYNKLAEKFGFNPVPGLVLDALEKL